MTELEPTPEVPDNTSIREVLFPDRIKDALFASGSVPWVFIRDSRFSTWLLSSRQQQVEFAYVSLSPACSSHFR